MRSLTNRQTDRQTPGKTTSLAKKIELRVQYIGVSISGYVIAVIPGYVHIYTVMRPCNIAVAACEQARG